ncbi:carbohydrate ABC transporter permease [Paenibacillus eucommiae]|uniref:Raffinose/stachyose/melibiose transport system permease protein n=1 Tax=Paenibacillus eucommiae TaxID=1355755 RepID=A0ABS4IRF9_9BACL|nr:sugar ABC transporter permease [Paenibacillus eucommiae]MBP1990157.1 raffinose/stachyose/melibiose transport system permease protein [Paenibacillus eucommiae]
MKSKMHNKYYPISFMLPAFFIFTLFYVFASVLGFVLAFTDWSSRTGEAHFVGLENFRWLLNDASLLTSLKNQFVFAIVTSSSKTFLGLLVALLLNMTFRGRNTLRTIVYMSSMYSALIVGYIFNYILRYDGLLNTFLRSIHLDVLAKDWLGDFNLALFSVAGVETWMWIGFNAVIILAGLQSIPREILECSEIDGANQWRRFISIKLPFIFHALNIAFLINLIGGLKAFDTIIAMTGGGPGHATEVISTLILKALSSSSLGYASAIGLVQFFVISIIAFSVNWVTSKKEIEL